MDTIFIFFGKAICAGADLIGASTFYFNNGCYVTKIPREELELLPDAMVAATYAPLAALGSGLFTWFCIGLIASVVIGKFRSKAPQDV